MKNAEHNPMELPTEGHLAPGELTPEESKEKEKAKEEIVKYLSLGAFDKALEVYSLYENLGLDEKEIISEGAIQYVNNNGTPSEGMEKLIENKANFELLYKDVFSSPHFTEWFKAGLTVDLSANRENPDQNDGAALDKEARNRLLSTQKGLTLPDEIIAGIKNGAVVACAEDLLAMRMRHSEYALDRLQHLKRLFSVSTEALHDTIKNQILSELRESLREKRFASLKLIGGISGQEIGAELNQTIQRDALLYISENYGHGPWKMLGLKKSFNEMPVAEETKSAVREVVMKLQQEIVDGVERWNIGSFFGDGKSSGAATVMEQITSLRKAFGIQYQDYPDMMNDLLPYAKSIAATFNLKSPEKFYDFYKKETEYVSYRARMEDEPCILEAKDVPIIKTLRLSPYEAERAKSTGVDLQIVNSEESYKALFEALTKTVADWGNEDINNKFEAGAQVFGYRNMFLFSKPGHRHDAFYAFDRALSLYRISGLPEKQFWNNILAQVARDDGEYQIAESEEGGTRTSYQILNDITASFRSDYETVFGEAKKYQIPQLQALVAEIENSANIFRDWKMLKKYHEFTKLLTRAELLQDLENEPNEKLKRYIATLAFHPSIENMGAVMNLWKNPRAFLDVPSSHTPENAHDSKKPSNYVEIPNLDLTAEDMRDALVQGNLDKIQAWQPLEIVYEFPKDVERYRVFQETPFAQIVSEALGKRGETKGKANQPSKLAKKIASALGIQMNELARIADGTLPVSAEKQEEVSALIWLDADGYKEAVERYRAKINLKSDPEGEVSGSDTKSCDAYGDGKRVLYTFNPVCGSFTFQKEIIGENRWTTIAQSIITRDKNVGVPITELRDALEVSQQDAMEKIPESILRNAQSVMAADSIEVNLNYRKDKYNTIIADSYTDFFHEYIARFGEKENLDTTKVITGSCNYDVIGTGTEENCYLPESPVAYSDKYKAEVRVIDYTKPRHQRFRKKVAFAEKSIKEETPIEETKRTKGVSYLTYHDTLQTAYLEGKIYEKTSLRNGLHEMENTLIAKDISNVHKNRPNMSLKYVNDEGQMMGYLLAYEGKVDKTGEPCLYIMDLAKHHSSIRAGAHLVHTFTQLYKKNYLSPEYLQKNKEFIPILAEARESTSFKILERELTALTEDTGKKFVMEELESYQVSTEKVEETIHRVMIRCVDKIS